MKEKKNESRGSSKIEDRIRNDKDWWDKISKSKYTKENSPWRKAQSTAKRLEKAILNCTWCNGQIKEQRRDYWECVGCGKYYEV
jgi:hypothetical protein